MIKIIERENGSRRVQFFTDGKTRVEQSHRDKVNINSIMSRYKKTGLMERRLDKPAYGDFTASVDYHEARNRLIEAESAFASLPASVRKRFGNNPAELIDFLNDENNLDEAVELGLLPKPEVVVEPETPEIPETPENPE